MNTFQKLYKRAFGKEGAFGTAVTVLIIAVLIVLNSIVFALDQTVGLTVSAPTEEDRTISDAGETVFAAARAAGRRATILFCSPEEVVDASLTGYYVLDTARQMAARYPDFISVDFVNIVAEPEKVAPYRTDEKGNDVKISRNAVIFKSGDSEYRDGDVYTISPSYASFFTLDSQQTVVAYNGEEILTAMIMWTMQKNHKNAYFTLGHSELMDVTFVNMLVCAGYNINTIHLRDGEIPDDADLIVISNPRNDFERADASKPGLRTEIERLTTFMERGGDLYVSLDPYQPPLENLETFLRGYGIETQMTALPNGNVVRNIVKDTSNGITPDGFTLVCDFADSDLAGLLSETVRRYNDGRVVVAEAGALSLSADARPILTASSASVIEAGGKTVGRDGNYVICAATSRVCANGETANVFVMPSIYASVSDALVTNGYANKDFLYSVFENLFGQTGVPYGAKVIRVQDTTLENLTMRAARGYTILLLVLPAALAVVGTVVTRRRKNR